MKKYEFVAELVNAWGRELPSGYFDCYDLPEWSYFTYPFSIALCEEERTNRT
jgi:hypothetical protein